LELRIGNKFRPLNLSARRIRAEGARPALPNNGTSLKGYNVPQSLTWNIARTASVYYGTPRIVPHINFGFFSLDYEAALDEVKRFHAIFLFKFNNKPIASFTGNLFD
jgi:hypothetical protein